MFFVNLMNINFNNRNNNRYLILFFTASVFGAIVFLASYEDIQSVMENQGGPNQMLAVMKTDE
jgi:hypothetical protein